MSKVQFGKVRWRNYAVNLNRKKTGGRLATSQGDVVFRQDVKSLTNEEQAAELKERYPGFIRTVAREAPIESGNLSWVVPDLSHIFKKSNRMARQEREDEERQRQENLTWDQ